MHHFLQTAPQARHSPGEQSRDPGSHSQRSQLGSCLGDGFIPWPGHNLSPLSADAAAPHRSAPTPARSALSHSGSLSRLQAPHGPCPTAWRSPGIPAPGFSPTFPRRPPRPRPSGPALPPPLTTPSPPLSPRGPRSGPAGGAALLGGRREAGSGARAGAVCGDGPGPRSPLRRPPAARDHYLAACPPGPVSAERDPGITIAQVPAAAQRACARCRGGAGIWRCPALPSRPRTRTAGLTPPATPTAFYSRAPVARDRSPRREHARPGRLLRMRCVQNPLCGRSRPSCAFTLSSLCGRRAPPALPLLLPADERSSGSAAQRAPCASLAPLFPFGTGCCCRSAVPPRGRRGRSSRCPHVRHTRTPQAAPPFHRPRGGFWACHRRFPHGFVRRHLAEGMAGTISPHSSMREHLPEGMAGTISRLREGTPA